MSVCQRSAIVGSVMVLAWSFAGLVVNPDFAIGGAATSELVLGVDMNGWHAVSGFLVAIPVLAVLKNGQLLPWVMVAASAGLMATAGWALLSEYPVGGLFYFPNRAGDVVLHIATASIFAFGAWVGLRRHPSANA